MSKAIRFKNANNEAIYVCPYFPVGSIYMSVNSTNPGTIFGGTWEQIKDRFLLACGSSYSNGSTGGSKTHTHTGPAHTHTSASHSHGPGGMTACIGSPSGNSFGLGFAAAGPAGPNSTYSVGGNTASASGHPGRSHNTQLVGNTESVTPGNTGTSGTGNTGSSSTMPPYLAVYVWKRVS